MPVLVSHVKQYMPNEGLHPIAIEKTSAKRSRRRKSATIQKTIGYFFGSPLSSDLQSSMNQRSNDDIESCKQPPGFNKTKCVPTSKVPYDSANSNMIGSSVHKKKTPSKMKLKPILSIAGKEHDNSRSTSSNVVKRPRPVKKRAVAITTSPEEAAKEAVTLAAVNWKCFDLDVLANMDDTLEPIPLPAAMERIPSNNQKDDKTITTPNPGGSSDSGGTSHLRTTAHPTNHVAGNTQHGMTYSEGSMHRSAVSPMDVNGNHNNTAMMITPPVSSSYTYPYPHNQHSPSVGANPFGDLSQGLRHNIHPAYETFRPSGTQAHSNYAGQYPRLQYPPLVPNIKGFPTPTANVTHHQDQYYSHAGTNPSFLQSAPYHDQMKHRRRNIAGNMLWNNFFPTHPGYQTTPSSTTQGAPPPSSSSSAPRIVNKKQPRPQICIPPKGIGPIYEPNHNDVLSGRGGRVNSHNGNVQFRELVAKRKKEYINRSTKKLQKAHIAADIVYYIRYSLYPSGRFLKEDEENSGIWYDIGDWRAIKKVGQALREDATELRINMDNANQPDKEKDGNEQISTGGNSSTERDSPDHNQNTISGKEKDKHVSQQSSEASDGKPSKDADKLDSLPTKQPKLEQTEPSPIPCQSRDYLESVAPTIITPNALDIRVANSKLDSNLSDPKPASLNHGLSEESAGNKRKLKPEKKVAKTAPPKTSPSKFSNPFNMTAGKTATKTKVEPRKYDSLQEGIIATTDTASSGPINSAPRRWFQTKVSNAVKSTLELNPDEESASFGSKGCDEITSHRDVQDASMTSSVTKTSARSSDELFGRPFHPPADFVTKSYSHVDVHTMISGITGITEISGLTDASSNIKTGSNIKHFEENVNGTSNILRWSNNEKYTYSKNFDENLSSSISNSRRPVWQHESIGAAARATLPLHRSLVGGLENASVTSMVQSIDANDDMQQSLRTTKTNTSSSIASSIISDLSGALQSLDVAPPKLSLFAATEPSDAGSREIVSLSSINPFLGSRLDSVRGLQHQVRGVRPGSSERSNMAEDVDGANILDHEEDDHDIDHRDMLALPDEGCDYSLASVDDSRHFDALGSV